MENHTKAIELNLNYVKVYENYEEAARDFKNIGILFYNRGNENCIKMFSICFDLRGKVKGKGEELVYCGLALYLLTADEKILEELKTLQVDDESMRKILEFSLRKSRGKEISAEVRKELEKEERDEIKLLLELLLNHDTNLRPARAHELLA